MILDLTLPGGQGGNDLIQQIRAIDPEVKAVISSGYLNHPVMTNFKNYGFDAAICKPFRISELSETLTNI